MQVLSHGKVVGTSQKWPDKAGGRSPKGPAVAGTTVFEYPRLKHLPSMGITYIIISIASLLSNIYITVIKKARCIV